MDDALLVQECLKGKSRAQKALFDKFAPKMLAVCYRYMKDKEESEDALQISMVKVFQKLDAFKQEGALEGWIRRIVVNTAIRHLERKKMSFKEIDDHQPDFPSVDPSAYHFLGEEDLLKLISALPEGYRMVFNLSVIEGYSHDEIAEMLNIQAGTSRSQLVKARKMLQSQILQLQKIAV